MKTHTKIFLYISLVIWHKPLYLSINKINGNIGESDGNKYVTLVSADESKDKLKKYEELWDNQTSYSINKH